MLCLNLPRLSLLKVYSNYQKLLFHAHTTFSTWDCTSWDSDKPLLLCNLPFLSSYIPSVVSHFVSDKLLHWWFFRDPPAHPLGHYIGSVSIKGAVTVAHILFLTLHFSVFLSFSVLSRRNVAIPSDNHNSWSHLIEVDSAHFGAKLTRACAMLNVFLCVCVHR